MLFSTVFPVVAIFPFVVGLLFFAGGCGIEPDTLSSITEVINRGGDSGLNLQAGTSLNSFSSTSGAAGKEGFDENGNPTLSGSPAFEPKYPERVNPFAYPSEAESQSVTPIGTSVTDIQVMGFANVEGHSSSDGSKPESKVLLKTNVGIKLLAVGEKVGSITVLRIDSPTVELQMGSLTWTATMFDR